MKRRVAALSNLGRRLSAVRTPREAAEIIVETADLLCGWDACFLDLHCEDGAGVASYSFHVEGTADWQWKPSELFSPPSPAA